MTRDEIAKMFEIAEFTCDTCPMADKCPCAFDPYNQHGDCLMEK